MLRFDSLPRLFYETITVNGLLAINIHRVIIGTLKPYSFSVYVKYGHTLFISMGLYMYMYIRTAYKTKGLPAGLKQELLQIYNNITM